MFLAAGRHTRLPAVARLRSACLTTLIALVVEFGLGMWLNIYVPVPAADQHAGIVREIANGPLLITVHILVGVFLIVAAIALLMRAVSAGHTKVVVLSSISLVAILGAFAAGDFFARDGEPRTSLWMALLTGVALLCCICVQALTGAPDIALADAWPGSEPEPGARLPYRPAAVPPQPAYNGAQAAGRPGFRQATGMGRRQPGYGEAMPGPDPAYRRAATGPRPAYPVSMPRPRDAYPPARPTATPRNGVPGQARPGSMPRPRQPGPPDYGYPDQR